MASIGTPAVLVRLSASMGISIIAAVSDNDVMGKNGKIPWFVRGEQAIFRKITMGHPIIMGRKTHESIGQTLPGRLNVVISRNRSYKTKAGSILAGSLKEALSLPEVSSADEVFIIGGAEIYKQALGLADKIYLTRVHANIEGGDKFFKFNPNGWRMTSSKLYKRRAVDDRPFDFEFQIWKRLEA